MLVGKAKRLIYRDPSLTQPKAVNAKELIPVQAGEVCKGYITGRIETSRRLATMKEEHETYLHNATRVGRESKHASCKLELELALRCD